MSVVVNPSARETFTPRELAAAYEDFIERGPQYLDAETGIQASASRFGKHVLIVYEESEAGLAILVHPGDDLIPGASIKIPGTFRRTNQLAPSFSLSAVARARVGVWRPALVAPTLKVTFRLCKGILDAGLGLRYARNR